MPPVVLKLFAGQGTGWMDKAATIYFPFGEHKKHRLQVQTEINIKMKNVTEASN